MILETNFAEVPDAVPLLDPGEYFVECSEVGFRDDEGNRLASHTFAFIINEGPAKGRKVFDDFPAKFLCDAESSAAVRFRHMLLSMGVTPSVNINTDDLKGRFCRVLVNHRNYEDKSTKETKSVAQIKSYVFKK